MMPEVRTKGVNIVKTQKVFKKVTTVYLYAMLTIFMFFCGTEGYTGILKAKFQMFCVICGGYILIMTVVALEMLLIGEIKIVSPIKIAQHLSWVQKFVICYLFITWVSALISQYAPKTILGASRYEGALTITFYCGCFLLVSEFGHLNKKLLYVFAAAMVAFNALCICQVYGYNPFNLYPDGYSYLDAGTAYSGEYIGTVGNVDIAAAVLCLAIPILWISIVRLEGKLKFLLLLPLAMSLFTLIKISVMAGFVGIIAGTGMALPVVLPLSKKSRKYLICFLVILLIIAIVLVYMTDFSTGFLFEMHEILHGRIDETFGSGRIYIWKTVLQSVPGHLLFGTGPDTMYYAGIEGFHTYYEALNQTIVSTIDIAHNEYLNILYHQGIFALVFYLSALICIFKQWVQKGRKDNVSAILGGAVLGYSIQAFFGLSACITAPFFWITLGLLEYHNKNFNRRDKV
jgi:hypothetical protein